MRSRTFPLVSADMKTLILFALAAGTMLAQNIPLGQEIRRGTLTIKAEPQERAPLSDPNYSGGAGLWLYVASSRLGVVGVEATVTVRLQDGRILARTVEYSGSVFVTRKLFFQTGSVESVMAVSVKELLRSEITDF